MRIDGAFYVHIARRSAKAEPHGRWPHASAC